MAFLDSSVIIDYLAGIESVVTFVDDQPRLLTSSLCVYEVLEGEARSTGQSDVVGARQAFGRVQGIGFNEEIALEAARMQDRLSTNGSPMPTYDLLIAASARSTGDTLVVRDRDFDVEPLGEFLDVKCL